MRSNPPAFPRLSPSELRRARGITLVEACAALSMASILACTAWPAMGDMVQQARLKGRSQELVGDLLQLRSLAIAQNQDMRLSVRADAGGSCYLLHTGGPQSCQCSSQGTASCTATGATVLKAVTFPGQGGVSVQSTSASILFDPMIGGAAPGGTIRMSDQKGREIRHIVSIRGRIRTCAAGPQKLGQPAC